MFDMATISKKIFSNKGNKIQDLNNENHKIVIERHKARAEQVERYTVF